MNTLYVDWLDKGACLVLPKKYNRLTTVFEEHKIPRPFLRLKFTLFFTTTDHSLTLSQS